MLDWIGTPVGALFALVPVFTLRALVFAFHKRGKAALGNLAVGVLVGFLGLGALLYAAFLLQPAANDPTKGFQGLAGTALQIAYDAFWIFTLGFPLSVIIAVLTHRGSARARGRSRRYSG